MCGFAGIVAWEDRYRVEREVLRGMSARIAHRGPDGEGAYLNYEGEVLLGRPQCGLVHRRLAVLDLNERALQPFEDAGGRMWLVFNGEIYNFRQLRDELSRACPEYRWRTECDTEVVLLAYQVWGARCLERFNGMFALAIWDDRTGSLFLARDRMGQKPLYYAMEERAGGLRTGVAFASELGALRAVPWVGDEIDPASVVDYFCWGYIPTPRTIYRKVMKLQPGCWMKLTRQDVEQARYFDPNGPLLMDEGREEDKARATRQRVMQAVSRQLVADVPVGCFLSGGMDSSIIAAGMKEAAGEGQEVMTFAIGFGDKRYDEAGYAARVAKHLGTKHERFEVRPEAAEDLPRLAEVFGEPFADSSALPTHYLSREVRGRVKVALSGDGGDELFGGYDRYRAMALSHKLRTMPRVVAEILGSSVWQWLPGTHPKSQLSRIKRLLRSLNLPGPRRYAAYMRLFDDATLMGLLGPGMSDWVVSRGDWIANEFMEQAGRRDVVAAALAVDRVTYLPDDLLAKVDRCSMLHGLEVRSPFMDHDLVEFAAELGMKDLIEGGSKRLLREAFAGDLPAEVFERPKMGFAMPIGEWLRNDLRGMMRDLLGAGDSFAKEYLQGPMVEKLMAEHEAGKADHSQRLYALVMMELWWKGRK